MHFMAFQKLPEAFIGGFSGSQKNFKEVSGVPDALQCVYSIRSKAFKSVLKHFMKFRTGGRRLHKLSGELRGGFRDVTRRYNVVAYILGRSKIALQTLE